MSDEHPSREGGRGKHGRVVFMMYLHVGSALIALGIAVAILGEPDWRWGLLAVALGVAIWLRMFRRIAMEMKAPQGKKS